MAVKRFRRKPEKPEDRGLLTVAQYKAGGPLDDLRAVAHMAGRYALAECALPDETVLVVRWMHVVDDHPPRREYEIVHDGDWLYYSDTYDQLGDDTTQGIEHFYDPAQ